MGISSSTAAGGPPSPLGKAWLKRFLAYTHIVRLNRFPLFLLMQQAQKKKLGKKKMPEKEFRSCGSDRRSRRLRQAFEKA
jgi:hypothetical protein